MGKEVFFIIALLLIFSMQILSAQPPFEQPSAFTTGYEIKFPPFGVLKQHQDFEFSFHVFNISDGVPITNYSTNCQFHLYNLSGSHLFTDSNMEYATEHGSINEWEVEVDGRNFSVAGDYSYIVQCNSTGLGGFESIEFQVTPTGTLLEVSDSITYSILTLGALFFFLLTLWGGIVLPFKNKRDGEGSIISVDKLKYFKVGLLFLSYVFFMWFLNLLLSLSTNFSGLTQYTKFFEVLFLVTNSISYPLFILMLAVMAIMAWKDQKLKKLLDRGLDPK